MIACSSILLGTPGKKTGEATPPTPRKLPPFGPPPLWSSVALRKGGGGGRERGYRYFLELHNLDFYSKSPLSFFFANFNVEYSSPWETSTGGSLILKIVYGGCSMRLRFPVTFHVMTSDFKVQKHYYSFHSHRNIKIYLYVSRFIPLYFWPSFDILKEEIVHRQKFEEKPIEIISALRFSAHLGMSSTVTTAQILIGKHGWIYFSLRSTNVSRNKSSKKVNAPWITKDLSLCRKKKSLYRKAKKSIWSPFLLME